MKFAIIDANREVVAVFSSLGKAKFHFEDEGYHSCKDWAIQPIMSMKEFIETSPDFRGFTNGRPSVCYFDGNVGTVLSFVYLIDDWSAYQMWTGKQYIDYLIEEDTANTN